MPNTLHHFITRYIVSVEKLEILLLLEEQGEKLWSAYEVFQKVQSSESSVAQRLQELAVEGFVECETGVMTRFRYHPKTEALKAGTRELKTAYRERRIRVIEMIFSKAVDPIHQFSDAFRIRKDEKNG